MEQKSKVAKSVKIFVLSLRLMAAGARIFVDSDESIIRVMIDFRNFLQPKGKKISDLLYKLFEGFVYSQRELGAVSTTSADAFVTNHIGKPTMSRKSLGSYRNELIKRGWLLRDGTSFKLPAEFDLHKRPFKKRGEIGQLLAVIERIGDLERENIDGAG